MLRNGWRRASAAYLALFFLAVAAAPHHHLNGLEDLLLDQRSDSGILIQTIGAQGTSEAPAINPYRVVHDVPCLACFTGDFVCGAPASFLLVAAFAPLLLLPAPPVAAMPAVPAADPSSRAPPLFS